MVCYSTQSIRRIYDINISYLVWLANFFWRKTSNFFTQNRQIQCLFHSNNFLILSKNLFIYLLLSHSLSLSLRLYLSRACWLGKYKASAIFDVNTTLLKNFPCSLRLTENKWKPHSNFWKNDTHQALSTALLIFFNSQMDS